MEILNILSESITYTAPLLIIALGGLYSERSGIVNIGLEGLFGIGAFTTAIYINLYGVDSTPQIWLGIIIGTLAAGIFSLLHAFACITMQADQVISGTAINILSPAITIFLARSINKSANIRLEKGLSKINNVYLTTYIILFIVILSWYIIYKTPFGLRLRACGENPQSAASLGISVTKMRYIGVFLSGLCAGLGGAVIIVTTSWEFSQNTYSGLGFLALAALVFGKWKPFGILASSLFFGFAKTVANLSLLYPELKQMPSIIFNTFPYVITLIALVIFSKNSVGPRAAGERYDVGKR